jgi:hypothetical protein
LLLILAVFGGRAWASSGSQVDTNNIYPNAGCVVFVPPPELSPPFVYFSGTLIHPRVVLTAAHTATILVNIPAVIPNLRISFGANALEPRTWHEIETAFVHPNYNPIAYSSEQSHDVGLVILKEPIYNLPPAKLPSAGLLNELKKAMMLREPGQGGVPFLAAGYGSTLTWPPPVITGGDGWRRFVDSEYLQVLPAYLLLLANPATGNGGVLPGDSGGPTFWTEPDGTRVVVGVNSMYCGLGTTWAARVDVPEVLDFINSVIQGLEP